MLMGKIYSREGEFLVKADKRARNAVQNRGEEKGFLPTGN